VIFGFLVGGNVIQSFREEIMSELYSPNLSSISLEEFFGLLKQKTMLPSRIVLQENVDEIYSVLKEHGLKSMADLTDKVKTKKRVLEFAAESGMDQELLILLRREALSWIPKPLPLKSMPGVPRALSENLETADIKHSKDLILHLQEAGSLDLLAANIGTGAVSLRTLIGMADLSRVNGIGPVFLRILAEAGIDTLGQLLEYEAQELVDLVLQTAENRGEKALPLTAADMEYCLWYARLLPDISPLL